MQLLGMMDSPYLRRVAITLRLLGIAFTHRPLSVFYNYDEFRGINPLVKVPTLILDDGEVLVDSSLIIGFLETMGSSESLMPDARNQQIKVLQLSGIGLTAMEKTAALIYELKKRPEQYRYEPWSERCQQQLHSACELMESACEAAAPWLVGERISHADVAVAVAWRFIQHVFPERISAAQFPALVSYSAHAEKTPEFVACPLSDQ